MTDSICEFLRTRIKSFVSEKDESLRWFSRQTDVDYTTIYRLSNGDQKTLSFLNASKILRLLEPTRYLGILSDYFPRETQDITRGSGDVFEKSATMDKVLADPLRYKVYVYASASVEKTRESVALRYGFEGIEHLDFLIGVQALIEGEKGVLRDGLEGEILLSHAALKQAGHYNIDSIDLSARGACIQNIHTNLSSEGIRKWYQATVSYRNALHDIAASESGEIAAVATVLVAPFLREGK